MTRTEVLRLIASLGYVVAVGMLAAERRIVRRLREAAATTPDTALSLPLRSPLARLRLARMRSGGAVVNAGQDRYYLDPEGYQRYRSARRHRALAVIGVVVTLFLVYWWLAGKP